MFAPGVPELMAEFESRSSELASFCVSVYVLGFAAGPMVFAPLSELYGRLIVYHVCNVGFIGQHHPLSAIFWPIHQLSDLPYPHSLRNCVRQSTLDECSYRIPVL